MPIIDKIRGQLRAWTDRNRKIPMPVWPVLAAVLLARKMIRHSIARAAERRYDKAWGIDTGGEITGKRLMITPETTAYAKGYAGTPPIMPNT